MKAYLTIGMPASGKSTWAEQQTTFININLDDCRAEICGDAGNQHSTPQAVILHDQKIKNAAANGQDIIVSDTNLNLKYRDILVAKLIDLGYKIEYVLFPISLELAKERNSKRNRVVPDFVLDNMYKSFQETNVSGKIVLGNTLVSNQLISELNQLATLEIVSPSIELNKIQDQLLALELITLNGQQFQIGSQLIPWLQERGVLHLSLISYLSPHMENILNDKLNYWPYEFSVSSLSELTKNLFSYELGQDKELSVISQLIQHKSILKTCFNEKDELINSAKLTEIIKEILK